MIYHVFKPSTGTARAVTDDKSGGKLPERPIGSWIYEKDVTINPGWPLIGANSNEVIAAIRRDGFYLWP
jgi:hypothetical protein